MFVELLGSCGIAISTHTFKMVIIVVYGGTDTLGCIIVKHTVFSAMAILLDLTH